MQTTYCAALNNYYNLKNRFKITSHKLISILLKLAACVLEREGVRVQTQIHEPTTPPVKTNVLNICCNVSGWSFGALVCVVKKYSWIQQRSMNTSQYIYNAPCVLLQKFSKT